MNERSNCLTSSFAMASENSTEATEAAEERSRGQISTVTIPVTANSTAPIANPVPMFSMNFDPRNVPADDPTICAPP